MERSARYACPPADVELLDQAIEEISGAPPSRAGGAGNPGGTLLDQAVPSAVRLLHVEGGVAIDLNERLDDVHENHAAKEEAMSIIREVRERVHAKLRELQPQGPGNEVLSMSLVILSLAISDPTTASMVTGINVHLLESRVWWASFSDEMAVLRGEYAHRRGLDRDTQPCPEAVKQMVIEWITGIDYGRAIHISSY